MPAERPFVKFIQGLPDRLLTRAAGMRAATVRSCEETAEIAGLTDESVCPTGQPSRSPKSGSEARRAKENSPGREPWVCIANLPAPERGERSSRLHLFRPVPGLACLSCLSQCSRTGLLCDAPPGLGLRQNRRALRRIGGVAIQSNRAVARVGCRQASTRVSTRHARVRAPRGAISTRNSRACR